MSDTLIGVVGTVVVGFLVYLGTRNTNFVTRKRDEKAAKIENDRADGEAYTRAMAINEQVTGNLRTEIQRLEAKVHELTAATDAAIVRARQAEERAARAEAERDVAVAQLADPRLRAVPPTLTPGGTS